jgi:hypothetical protein
MHVTAVTAANWKTNNLTEAIRQLCFGTASDKIRDEGALGLRERGTSSLLVK